MKTQEEFEVRKLELLEEGRNANSEEEFIKVLRVVQHLIEYNAGNLKVPLIPHKDLDNIIGKIEKNYIDKRQMFDLRLDFSLVLNSLNWVTEVE